MRKENVFVVSVRTVDSSGEPRGAISNHVVCATNEASLRLLVGTEMPQVAITSVTSLVALERTVQRIKGVLRREDLSWSLLLEPGI